MARRGEDGETLKAAPRAQRWALLLLLLCGGAGQENQAAGVRADSDGPRARWVDAETFRRSLRKDLARWEAMQDARRPFEIPVRGCARAP
jgi:hypothetical protein